MSKPTGAPELQLAELHRRNAAFAAQLDPVVDRLRGLQDERTELLKVGFTASRAQEAAMGRDEWVHGGAQRYSVESGQDVAARALGKVADALRELDMPPAAQRALDEAIDAALERRGDVRRSANGRIPSMIEEATVEGHRLARNDGARAARRGVVEALQHGREVIAAAGTAYVMNDLGDDQEQYEAALSKALLILTAVEEDAAVCLEQRASERS